MTRRVWKLLLDIFLGLALNIAAGYFLIPRLFLPSGRRRVNHYNINDVYVAIYIGLILSAIELVVIGIGVIIFMD